MIPWLLLVGCRPDPAPGGLPAPTDPGSDTAQTTGTHTADTAPSTGHTGSGGVDPAGIHWVSDPVPVPEGGLSQNHATVALHPSGVAFAVYDEDTRLLGVRVQSDGSVEPAPVGAPSNHGQVVAAAEGFLAVATVNGGGALLGGSFAIDGSPSGGLARLSSTHPYLPDIAVRTDEAGLEHGVVVSTNTIDLACLTFEGALDAVRDAPCPSRVDPERAVGTVSVAFASEGPRYAWTELATDGSTAVFVSDGKAPPLLVADIAHGAGMAGRPMVRIDEDRELVVYRGAESSDDVVGSWLWLRGPNGEQRWRLGNVPETHDVERVALSGAVDGRVVVAWEESDQLWMQLRSSIDGSPIGASTSVGTDPDREPRRPSVGLVLGDDGDAQGVISWEAALPGSEVEGDGRQVRTRRFVVP